MKRIKEKVPGFDEIIFENRNKEYGAYVIRKKYLPATIWSIIAGSVLFSALVTLLSMGVSKDAIAEPRDPIIIVVQVDSTLRDINKLREAEPPKRVEKPFLANVAPEIKTTVDSGDVLMAASSTLDTAANKPVDQIIIPEIDPGPGVAVEPEPVIVVTEPPVFPGGDAALMKFIYDNVKYPEEASINNIEGKVTVKFVVSTDGSVKRVEILKGADPLLNEEAKRVISLLPKWKPGKNNGDPAAVWFIVPVTFTLKR
jgi:periplasmic protein TonB